MRIKIAILLFLLSFTLDAQEQVVQNLPRFDQRLVHFGFTLGFNNIDFTIKRPKSNGSIDSVLNITTQHQFGFQIAIVSDLRLGDNFNLRFIPGLSFGDRIINYDVRMPSLDTIIRQSKTAESTFIDFPLLFKYKTDRVSNFRAYVLFGGKYSYDLASQFKKKQEDEMFIKIYPNDFSLDIGTGVEWYLQYFKFGIELRMSYGVKDVLKRENTIYTDNIDKLKSKIWWLSFTFE